MKIWGIELGKSYYGYDCIDNGSFRLIRYLITEKSTWSFKARRFMISEYGETELASWAGYPDNLYKTAEAAIEGLKANVQKLDEAMQNKAPHFVNSVYVDACCETCSKCIHETMFCTEYKTIVTPGFSICKEGSYSCDAQAVNSKVRKAQANK